MPLPTKLFVAQTMCDCGSLPRDTALEKLLMATFSRFAIDDPEKLLFPMTHDICDAVANPVKTTFVVQPVIFNVELLVKLLFPMNDPPDTVDENVLLDIHPVMFIVAALQQFVLMNPELPVAFVIVPV